MVTRRGERVGVGEWVHQTAAMRIWGGMDTVYVYTYIYIYVYDVVGY